MKVKIVFENGEPVIHIVHGGSECTITLEEAEIIARAAKIVRDIAMFNEHVGGLSYAE